MAEYAADGPVSKMQLQRVAYRNRAIAALESDFAWLIDREACNRGEQRWRPAILAELGRHGDAENIRDVAAQLTEYTDGRDLSDAECVALLKGVRGILPRGTPEADVDELTGLIVATINEYAESHHGARPALLRGALAKVKIVDPEDN